MRPQKKDQVMYQIRMTFLVIFWTKFLKTKSKKQKPTQQHKNKQISQKPQTTHEDLQLFSEFWGWITL